MHYLDGSLDPIQNTRFHNCYHNLIRKLIKQTQFSDTDLCCILMIYHKFVLANGPTSKYMTRQQITQLFLVLFEIHDYRMVDKIIFIISPESVREIYPKIWVSLLKVFFSTDIEQRMLFTFSVYTANNANGVLDRPTIAHEVAGFFSNLEEDEAIAFSQDMVELILKKFDADKDGAITYEEYSNVVRKQPLLLEFLGRCLPTVDNLRTIAHCVNVLDMFESRNTFSEN